MPKLPSYRLNSLLAQLVPLAFMVLTASLLAGCVTTSAPSPLSRNLPGPPSYLQPLSNPPANEGDSPFIVAAKRGAVVNQQNTIIRSARRAWQKMKDAYK